MPPVLGWPLQGQAPCAFVSMISASLVISRCRLGLCLSNHHATMTAFTFAYEQKLEWLLRTTYGFYGPYNARQWYNHPYSALEHSFNLPAKHWLHKLQSRGTWR
jgi:hypothetical protein